MVGRWLNILNKEQRDGCCMLQQQPLQTSKTLGTSLQAAFRISLHGMLHREKSTTVFNPTCQKSLRQSRLDVIVVMPDR